MKRHFGLLDQSQDGIYRNPPIVELPGTTVFVDTDQ
jgi:hypothetical protein